MWNFPVITLQVVLRVCECMCVCVPRQRERVLIFFLNLKPPFAESFENSITETAYYWEKAFQTRKGWPFLFILPTPTLNFKTQCNWTLSKILTKLSCISLSIKFSCISLAPLPPGSQKNVAPSDDHQPLPSNSPSFSTSSIHWLDAEHPAEYSSALWQKRKQTNKQKKLGWH